VAKERAAARQVETTASAIYRGIRRLIEGNDRVLGRSLCDVLVTRYPGTEFALDARVLIAAYHCQFREFTAAVETYRAVIEDAPDSLPASRARAGLPSALFKAGRHDEAVQAWVDYGEAGDSDKQRACGYYNAASMLVIRGRRHYPQAMRLYRTVVTKYPAVNYARAARARLARLEKQIEGDVLDGVLDM